MHDNKDTNLDDLELPKSQEQKKTKKKKISFEQEIVRKSIHLTSLAIPILYIFATKSLALSILIPMALVAVTIDLLSKFNPKVREWLKKNFGGMLRKHELKKKKIRLNGASWVLISAVITVAIFPKVVAITAFLILIICDIFAAIIGRKYGKTKLFNKTWEGTYAFFVSGLITISIFGAAMKMPVSYYLSAAAAVMVSAFIEAAAKRIKLDDNLAIPMSAGIVLWIGALITSSHFGPFLDLLK